MPLSTLRAGLKSAITSNTNYTAYDHVPEIIIPPAALILASDPYLEPIVIGNSNNYYVRLTLEIVSSTYSNPSALNKLGRRYRNSSRTYSVKLYSIIGK
jgi:hypothetical protein